MPHSYLCCSGDNIDVSEKTGVRAPDWGELDNAFSSFLLKTVKYARKKADIMESSYWWAESGRD